MFYEELKKHRESLGISLEQISNKIKISKSVLAAFEAGEFSGLPETYVRLFLKAYAIEIELDPKKVLRDYEIFIGKVQEETEPEKRDSTNSFLSQKTGPVVETVKKRNVAAITVVLVVLIFLISILKQVLMEEEKNKPAPVNPVTEKLPVPIEDVDTTATTEGPIEEKTNPVTPAPEKLTLLITTSDTCWVRVITDGKDTTEANYQPNIRKEWKAETQFDVRVGRPTKVELWLNNKALGPIGNAGIPTRAIITKDGIIRSTLLNR
ncbi:MAG: DUF4115 domain-containing protein [Candidatus Marinimicrobia bacterium]|nr:DUF4115 domain-containing protein [Candidatus Neomarinimicrobiota bacterium]RKY60979.1 MAG: hypothetical protein DRP96_04520 [Candidatus Neomarinimicrobiota bacterium]